MAVSPEAAAKFCEERIAALNAEIESIRALRFVLNNHEFTDQLAKLLVSTNGHKTLAKSSAGRAGPRKTPSKPSAGDGNFAKVKAYFASIQNEWKSTREIIEGGGVSRGNLSNIIYKAQKDEFESKPHPTVQRVNLWRLKIK